jgi:hypothetical protein
MRPVVGSIEGEFRRYKLLGEGAIAQLSDEEICRPSGGNSVATIVWHVSGNFASRFTDFLSSDGEKPWRDREAEFLPRSVSQADVVKKWEEGWAVLFRAFEGLDDQKLQDSVKIRGVALSVTEALHRSLAHAAYHVGQMVVIGKEIRGREWKYLTIPPGGSAAYNAKPLYEKPPTR